MGKFVDLHTHSTASDGSFSPGQLVRHAKTRGLSAIALTDHDTVDGIAEALEEARSESLEVIPGVEISVDYKPEMHILGYFSSEKYINIKPVLVELRENRERRNPKIVNKLNELGFDLTIEEVKAEAKGGVVGRPHIAKVLVRKGYVKSVEEAFERLLAGGRPAYFKKDKLTPEEGIQKIEKAGGVPVLAHPIHLGITLHELDELLGSLCSAGLKGIETYYVDNSEEDTGNLLRLALKHDLIPTGGSDFHGIFKTRIEIGEGYGNLKVPYEAVERIKALL